MTHPEFTAPSYAQEVLNRSQDALLRAVAAVSPENPDANPFDIFPAPGEVRAEDTGLNLDAEQETALRSAAAELGFGRETDRTASELGLQGAHIIIEGGQPHKMMAEAKLILEDTTATPSTIFFSASQKRKITGADEQASAARLDVTGENEYDVSQKIAKGLPGFKALEKPEVMPVSYDIHNDFQPGSEQSGQLIRIGSIGQASVVMLRVDREDYVTAEGRPKYKNQPGVSDILRLVDAASSANGDDVLPIAFVTSATYQPSREVDAATVSLQTGRVIGVPTYGTARLDKVKGVTAPTLGPIIQLPGELYKLALEVQKLEAVLAQPSE